MIKIRHKIIGAALSLAVVSLALFGVARAASGAFSYDTKVTYSVIDDSTTNVEEVYTVTNSTARQYLTELKLTTPSDKISKLRVTYADGSRIPTSVTKKSSSDKSFGVDTQEITIAFPRVNAGSGLRWTFVVSYNTASLIETKGSAHTVYVPALQSNDQRGSYTATVDVPQSFGTPHFTNADDHLVLKNGDRQTYQFDRKELVDHSLALVFGDSTIYNVVFNAPLTNNSPVPRTMTVTLPPDLNTQKSAVKSLDPKPNSTRLDVDGNVLADYNLGAYQHMTVVAKVEAQVSYHDYDLSRSGTKDDLPDDLVAKYTRSTHYWSTDGAVAEAAKSVVNPSAKVSDNVRAVYRYVIDKLTYNNDKIKFNVRQGASKALANPGNAVCLEYADLMIAMLRSQGIPARMMVGYAYAGSIKASPAVDDSLHAWVEAYVPNVGWMSVDPTWGEKFDDFGRSDLDHFAFAVWGRSDSSPAAVMLGSTDTGYQYENTQLSFSNAPTSISTAANVAVRRYTILPLVSVDHIWVDSKSQAVTNNNTMIIDGRQIKIGSLAPGQRVERSSLALGLHWNDRVNVMLVRPDGSHDLIIAKTTAVVSYKPMLIMALLLIALYLISVVRLRTKHRASRVKKIYTDYKRGRNILDE